jgi:hypothetical protein
VHGSIKDAQQENVGSTPAVVPVRSTRMTGPAPPPHSVTLFEEVMALEFSEAEKDRIGHALADVGSLQARVLSEKGPLIRDHEFWGRGQRKFKIRGFRDGHPGAIKRMIARALAAAKSHKDGVSNADWPLIWPLYERSARIYLQDEMPELSELLMKEEFEGETASLTDQVLRRIVSCLPLYQATLDQARTLYELWGFERTESIDAILSRAPLEADAARRMIDNSVRTVQKEMLAALSSARTEMQRQIEQHRMELESVKTALKVVQHDIGGQRSKRIPDAPLHLKPEVVAPPVSALTRSSNPDLNQAALATVESLRTRVENMSRQLKEIRIRLDESPERRERNKPTTPPGASRGPLVTMQQAIDKWRDAFCDSGLPNSFATGRVMLEIVRRSRVVLTSKPMWMTKLFASIADGVCRTSAASPLWISDADWKEELAFITEDTGQPRLLVLEDFDVALQDAYLVPAIITWLSTLQGKCTNRIVLVPSSGELANISPRILEIATFATHDAPYIRDISSFDSSAMPPPNDVPQAAADLLAFSRVINVNSETQLRRYVANLGIALAPRVAEGFVNLDEGLRPLLGRRGARIVAQEATLMPWTACARGAASEKILRGALQVVNGE